MNQRQQTPLCPICGHKDTSPFLKCQDYMVSGELFTVSRCNHCGLLCTEPVVSDSDMMKKYAKVRHRIQYGDKPGTLVHAMYWIARNIMVRRKKNLITHFCNKDKGTLLNFAANIGYFSQYMENKDWKVFSLERSHQERQFSLEMYHHRIFDEIEIDALRPASFDAVTVWHRLLNRQSPYVLLDKIHRLLSPEGVLLITQPNPESLDAKYYGADWAGWDVPRHRWHITPQQMQEFASQHGYIMLYREALPFDIYYMCILSEKNRKKPLSVLRGLLRGLRFHIKCIGHKDSCSSLLYVLRKKPAKD